uniref:CPG4 domain-containing protein n=1 Tax=Heterorhabditis bacteriophora TaxID=37862 RepID=A0A1I7WQA0_HETBA
MLINLLLLVSGVYGAAIPPQPQIPTTSQCLRDCFEVGSLVNAAFDLTNFKSIAVDIENFCRINSALLKCGRECPEEQMAELEARTQASSFACSEKVEEFRLVSECLDSAPDVVEKCSSDCRFSSDHTPIRLDSSPAALVNPTVLLDGIGDTCQKHMCIVKCSIAGFNKACSGSGDLFKMMTLNYLHNLPKECVFMKDSKAYDKTTSSMFEFEPNNDPEVPVGPPEKTSDEMSNELDTTTSSQEPVIVIEDSARKEGENDIVAGGVEEVVRRLPR